LILDGFIVFWAYFGCFCIFRGDWLGNTRLAGFGVIRVCGVYGEFLRDLRIFVLGGLGFVLFWGMFSVIWF